MIPQPVVETAATPPPMVPVSLPSEAELAAIKARAKAKFVTALDRAIENVMAISEMTVPEIREVAGGREGTVKAIKIDASPTALQANLAIIDRALGKQAEREEGPRFTVPIQINMGGGRVVDVQAPAPVTVTMPDATP